MRTLTVLAVLVGGIGIESAGASVILTIPAYETPTITSPILDNGKEYIIEVRGTYRYGNEPYNEPCQIADAEWLQLSETGPGVWYEYAPGSAPFPDVLDLLVNDTAQDWLGPTGTGEWPAKWLPHTFNEDHIYRLPWTGTGQAITFRIEDSVHVYDNSGSLEVEITPEPAMLSLLALGGLAVMRRRRRSTVR